MIHEEMRRIWILMQSRRGIFLDPEIFYAKKDAINKKLHLLHRSNPVYDEIEVFEKRITTGHARTTRRHI